MGTREDGGTRHFSRMINSPGIPRLILFISFIRNEAVRALIYTAAPFISSTTLSHSPPKLHFFFSPFPSPPPRIRGFASFLSSMARIDCLADGRGIQAIFSSVRCFTEFLGLTISFCSLLSTVMRFFSEENSAN